MPGFEAKFTHPLLKRHECPICVSVMRNPVQTECGHLFCRDCLEPVLKRRYPICPLDKEEITQEGTFPDNACRREISKLQVSCNYQNCPWVGTLKDLEGHVATCEYHDEQCTQCGQYIQQKDMAVHQKEVCSMRPTTCPHCKKDVPTQQLPTHFDKLCAKIMRTCPNECDPSLQMNLQELEAHLDMRKGTCPLSAVECPCRAFGCTFISQRKNMVTHMEQYKIYHTQITNDSFKEFRQMISKSNLSIEHVLERVGSLETRSNALERLQDALEQRIEFLDDRKDRHADQNQTKIKHLEEQAVQNTSLITQLDKRITDIDVKTGGSGTGLTSGYHTGSTAYSTAHPVTSSLQGFGEANVSAQRVESIHSRVVELEHSIDIALSSCLDQELRIQLLERATYNGVLLWKIDDFERHRHEAVDRVTMSLYSTPFYTSRHDYKMCARIYLNGDGMGKGSHLSFFFVVMRGPFDALLQWPFKQKVTQKLINQNGQKHISDGFRPDPHSSGFQKPGQREMNIASGCPVFIRIDALLQWPFRISLKGGVFVMAQHLKWKSACLCDGQCVSPPPPKSSDTVSPEVPPPMDEELTVECLQREFDLTDEQLDTALTLEKDAPALANEFENIEMCCDSFGLKPADRGDIKDRQQRDGVRAAVTLSLQLWIKKNPLRATFRNLLRILLWRNDGVTAVAVCKYIKQH